MVDRGCDGVVADVGVGGAGFVIVFFVLNSVKVLLVMYKLVFFILFVCNSD